MKSGAILSNAAHKAERAFRDITEREPVLWDDPLAAARSIPDRFTRISALVTIALLLPDAKREAALREALAAATAFLTDKENEAVTGGVAVAGGIVAAIAPFLPEARAAARGIRDLGFRLVFAPFLPEAEREAALREALAVATAHSSEAKFDASYLRAALDAYEIRPRKAGLWDDPLAAARSIPDGDARITTLAQMALLLPDAKREAALWETLAAAMALLADKENEAVAVGVVGIIAPFLPEARDAARGIPDDRTRIGLRLALAPHLLEAEREAALREGLLVAATTLPGEAKYDASYLRSVLNAYKTESNSTVENSEITADNKHRPRISGAARITGEKDVGPMNGPVLKAERHLGDVLREALRVARVECPDAVPAIEQGLRIAESKVAVVADHKTLPLPVLTEDQITAMMQRGSDRPWKNRDSSLRRVSPVRYFEDNYNDIVGDDALIPLSILRKADRDLYDRINNWKSDASNRDAVKRFVTRDEIHLAEAEILATRPDLLPAEQQAQVQLTAGRRVLRQLGYKR